FKLVYIILIVILSTSFIFGQWFATNVFINVIGAYWLAIFSLLILMLPIAHLIIWLFRLTPMPRRRMEKWIGYIILCMLIGLIGYGSFNAYNPTVHSYDIHIAKDAKRQELPQQ